MLAVKIAAIDFMLASLRSQSPLRIAMKSYTYAIASSNPEAPCVICMYHFLDEQSEVCKVFL